MTMEHCPYCKYDNIPHELMKSNKGITMGIIGASIFISIIMYLVLL